MRFLTFDRNCKEKDVCNVAYNGKTLTRYTSAWRGIYRVDNYIIKIDVDDGGGYLQTENEINFYRRLKPEDAKFFPRFVTGSSSRGVVVTEFVPMLGSHEGKYDCDYFLVGQLAERYKIADVGNYNWAIHKELRIPIIFDMGYRSD